MIMKKKKEVIFWNDTIQEIAKLRKPVVGGMLRFIDALRQTDKYIEMIYMNGACYQFHLFLKIFFPESKPYISKEKDHVITKYAGKSNRSWRLRSRNFQI